MAQECGGRIRGRSFQECFQNSVFERTVEMLQGNKLRLSALERANSP